MNLGVQHLPGYPLHTLSGRLACAVPFGSIYWRVNLLGDSMCAACGTLVTALVWKLCPGPLGMLAGVSAGLVLGWSGTLWDVALSAKGGIYTLNLLISLLALSLAISRSPAAWLALGIGLANHWMSIVCWIPGLIWIDRPRDLRQVLMRLVLVMLGLSCYLQLPLCGWREPVYGDPVTAGGLLDIIFRRGLVTGFVPRGLTTMGVQFLWSVLRPIEEFGVMSVLIVAVGSTVLWKENRSSFLSLFLCWSGTLLGVSVVANPIHIRSGDLVYGFTAPFLIPSLGPCAIMVGIGMHALVRWSHGWGRSMALSLVLVIPVLVFWEHRAANDHSQDYLGFDYAENLRAKMEPTSIFFTEMEFYGQPALAMHYVECRGPQVELAAPNLAHNWGWRRIARKLPEAMPLVADERDRDLKVVALMKRLSLSRPVYYPMTADIPGMRGYFRPHGLVRQFVGSESVALPDDAETAGYFDRFRLRGLFGDTRCEDRQILLVLDTYGYAASLPGDRLRMAGRTAEAIPRYLRAVRFPGWLVRAENLRALGLACGISGYHAEAEKAFREAAHLKPGDLSLWMNVCHACLKQGKRVEAMECLDRVLKKWPHDAQAQAMWSSLLQAPER